MITIKDKKLKMIVNLFKEILQNYIDKFTIYQIPNYLQLIHFNQQISILPNPYRVFENVIEELAQIDKILDLRGLKHLKICPNLSQLLVTLLASTSNFTKVHDKILTSCYQSSISYKEYVNEMTDNDKGANVLKDEHFLRYHRERMARLKVNERRIFGN